MIWSCDPKTLQLSWLRRAVSCKVQWRCCVRCYVLGPLALLWAFLLKQQFGHALIFWGTIFRQLPSSVWSESRHRAFSRFSKTCGLALLSAHRKNRLRASRGLARATPRLARATRLRASLNSHEQWESTLASKRLSVDHVSCSARLPSLLSVVFQLSGFRFDARPILYHGEECRDFAPCLNVAR